jgi:hypothetical protein
MWEDFCKHCGCGKDPDDRSYDLCEDCLEEIAEEREIYL